MSATTATQIATNTVGSSAGSGIASMLQMLLGLIIVLAIIFAAAWLLKRIGLTQGRGAQWLKPISALSVGTRERIVVVEINQQWLVLGVTPQHINLLQTIANPPTEPPDAPGRPPHAADFAEKLKQLMMKKS